MYIHSPGPETEVFCNISSQDSISEHFKWNISAVPEQSQYFDSLRFDHSIVQFIRMIFFESYVHMICMWYLSYVWNVKHTMLFLDSMKYSVIWSNMQEEQGSDTRVRTQKNPVGFFGYTHLKNPPAKNPHFYFNLILVHTLYATNNAIFYCF